MAQAVISGAEAGRIPLKDFAEARTPLFPSKNKKAPEQMKP